VTTPRRLCRLVIPESRSGVLAGLHPRRSGVVFTAL
jgi:hypothetical protein